MNYFPTITQCSDLMALVESNPTVLELCSIVQFSKHDNFYQQQKQQQQNSHTLADFIAALERNTSIVRIHCNRHFTTGFNEEEWCQIVLAFGSIRSLRDLVFVDGGDSRLRRVNINVLATVIQRNNKKSATQTATTTTASTQQLQQQAQKLRRIEFGKFWLLTDNDGQRHCLATALRHHATLEVFSYAGCGLYNHTNHRHDQLLLYQSIAPRSAPNAILDALGTCPNLKAVHIVNSPYCAFDYTPEGLASLMLADAAPLGPMISNNNNNKKQLRELSLVTNPCHWKLFLNDENDTTPSLPPNWNGWSSTIVVGNNAKPTTYRICESSFMLRSILAVLGIAPVRVAGILFPRELPGLYPTRTATTHTAIER